MLEKVLDYDTSLLLLINNWGSKTYDGFWIFITDALHWIPFFVLIFILILKKTSTRQLLVFIMGLLATLALTFLVTELCKIAIARPRPVHLPELRPLLRIIVEPKSYSFFSGHACNSFGLVVFTLLLIRKQSSYIYLFLLWPILFVYSRLYLGVHYPVDVFAGIIVGSLTGWLVYSLIKKKFTVSGTS